MSGGSPGPEGTVTREMRREFLTTAVPRAVPVGTSFGPGRGPRFGGPSEGGPSQTSDSPPPDAHWFLYRYVAVHPLEADDPSGAGVGQGVRTGPSYHRRRFSPLGSFFSPWGRRFYHGSSSCSGSCSRLPSGPSTGHTCSSRTSGRRGRRSVSPPSLVILR